MPRKIDLAEEILRECSTEHLYTQKEQDEAVDAEREKLFALMQGLEIENIQKFILEGDVGDYGKLGLLITQKVKHAVKAKTKKLRDALEEAISLIKGVEIFVKSREKINKPTGEEWLNDKLTKLKEALKDGE